MPPDVVKADCPFCGGRISFNFRVDYSYATHSIPFCKTFDEAEDALAFIVKVNNALGVRRS